MLAVLAVVCLPLIWFVSNAGAALYSCLFLSRPTMQELIGEYSVRTSSGEAQLVLRNDGTFSEALVVSGKVLNTVSGHWQNQTSSDDNAKVLIISPHLVLNNAEYDVSKEAFFLFYKPRFGRIYGDANPDIGPRFVKRDN